MTLFKPGESGNPQGKRKGAKSKYTLMREALADDLPQLLEATKAAALSGDITAMRLLLERTLPPYKAAAAPVSLPELEQANTLTDYARAMGGGTVASRGLARDRRRVGKLLRTPHKTLRA